MLTESSAGSDVPAAPVSCFRAVRSSAKFARAQVFSFVLGAARQHADVRARGLPVGRRGDALLRHGPVPLRQEGERQVRLPASCPRHQHQYQGSRLRRTRRRSRDDWPRGARPASFKRLKYVQTRRPRAGVPQARRRGSATRSATTSTRRPTRSIRTSIPTTTSRCGTRSRRRASASAQIITTPSVALYAIDATRRFSLPSPSTPSTRLAGSRRQAQGAAGAAAEAAPQDQGRARRARIIRVRARPARQDQAEQQVPRVGADAASPFDRIATTDSLVDYIRSGCCSHRRRGRSVSIPSHRDDQLTGIYI